MSLSTKEQQIKLRVWGFSNKTISNFLCTACALSSKAGRKKKQTREERLKVVNHNISDGQVYTPRAVPWFKALPRERIVCMILFNLAEPLIWWEHDMTINKTAYFQAYILIWKLKNKKQVAWSEAEFTTSKLFLRSETYWQKMDNNITDKGQETMENREVMY